MDSTGHVPSQPLSPDEARRYSELSPFQLKDELIRWARRLHAGRSGDAQVPRRGARQPELDRDHAARGVLPARAVRARGVEARLGRARPRRHAAAERHRRAPARPSSQRADGARRRCCCGARSTTASTTLGFDADAFVHELADAHRSATTTPSPTACSCTPRRSCARYLDEEMCDGRPPAGHVRPLRRRGRHRGDVLRLRAAWSRTAPRAAATRSRSARRSSRPTSRSRTSTSFGFKTVEIDADARWRTGATPGSTPTPRSTSSRIRRSRRSSSSTPATRRRARCATRRSIASSTLVRDQAPGPDHPHRRRLRHVRRRLPLAGGRAAAQHDPRLLVLEVLRLHRLAPRRRRAARGQRHRPMPSRAARGDRAGAARALRHR